MQRSLVLALCVLLVGLCVRPVQAQCRDGCNTHPSVAGLTCISGLANESGAVALQSTSGIPACAAGGTYEIQHATRFDVIGNTEITHLCISTASSTLSVVQIFSASGSPNQPPAAVPLFSVVNPAVSNSGNMVIVGVAPVATPLVVNGSFWVVVTYSSVMPTTVTQGIAARTGGKAMLRVNQNCNLCVLCGAPCSAALSTCQTWVDYDSLPMFQYIGNAPRIRPLRFDSVPFCPAGGQYTQNCCNQVCAIDPTCCTTWDPICFAIAAANCPSNCDPIPPAGSYVEQELCPGGGAPPPNDNNVCFLAEVVPCSVPAIYGRTSASGGLFDEDWYAIDLFNHNASGIVNFQFSVQSESPVEVEVWTGDQGVLQCNLNQTLWLGGLATSCGITGITGNASFPIGVNTERFFLVVRSAVTDRNACTTDTNDYVVHFNLITNCATQSNDDCINAIPLNCNGPTSGSTGAATASNPPNCGPASGLTGVWYSIVGNNENIRIDSCGSTEPVYLAAYIGTCGSLGCIASAPFDTLGVCLNPSDASLEFFGFSGITYYIYVAPQAAQGDFTLNVSCAPPNDDCSQPEIIGCGATTQGNSANASNTGAPICNGIPNAQGDLWYYLPAGPGGMVTADLCGSLVNHQISVYTGICGALTCIDATFSDTLGVCGGVFSSIGFFAAPGQDYYILVHANGPTGQFTLNINCPPAGPPNDFCATAQPVGPGIWPWDNCTATTDGPPSPCGFTGLPNDDLDIWYEFVLPCDGTFSAMLPPAPFDQGIELFSACPLAGGVPLGCASAPAGAPAAVSGVGVAGETFLIRVGGILGSCGHGLLDITLMCNQLCPPDCVTNATLLPPPDGIVDGADLAVLLGAWGACPGCCADTVSSATLLPPPDGIVDGADLAVLLGAWGNPGCPNGFP